MVTRSQLEKSRIKVSGIYGYKKAFCDLQSSCDVCDKKVRFICKIICFLEDIQCKRILKICKEDDK